MSQIIGVRVFNIVSKLTSFLSKEVFDYSLI